MKSKRAKSLMVLGTGSGVGKSVIVAGILRALARRGVRCAPFKAQNMALNSFVTHDGKEMGRAQVYQAEAAGLLPDCRMNPILLKPNGDSTSQVIILGTPRYTVPAKEYYQYFDEHLTIVQKAFDELAHEFDVIVMEGAGSPAEINLQDRDLVNTRMADYANAPCLLVGDIDKGGVFAWLKGTLDLIEPSHQGLVRGIVINKFRGDVDLLKPGLRQFESIANVPIVGVLPWLDGITIDQEDGMFTSLLRTKRKEADLHIGIVRLNRISNFTDFIPLTLEDDCEISLISSRSDLNQHFDCIVIPGSKATISDLKALRGKGILDVILKKVQERATVLLGICGGYQMLGKTISDPQGIEGAQGEEVKGMGLLPIETRMSARKHLSQTTVNMRFPGMEAKAPITGYEIHAGRSCLLRQSSEFIPLCSDDPALAVARKDFTVIGTYLHGIFENDHLRRAFLNMLRQKKGLHPIGTLRSYKAFKEKNLDSLANWIEEWMDMDWLGSNLGLQL